MMLDYAQQGQISNGLLAQALQAIALKPEELRDVMHQSAELLQQLFNKKLSLGDFVEQWNKKPDPSVKW
jgi:hypothetical protein